MTNRRSKSPNEAIPFSLRLPPEVHADLARVAAMGGKSLNSLMIEILSEEMRTLRIVGAAAESDLLASAYYSAESAEMYARAVRGAILRFKKLEGATPTSPSQQIPIPTLPTLGEPIDQLTPFQRELAEEVANLSPEEQAALLTIIRKPQNKPHK